MMTRHGLKIGPEYLLDVASVDCCVCQRLIKRGWVVRQVLGIGTAHSACVPEDYMGRIVQALFEISPATTGEVQARAGVSSSAASDKLRLLLAAGIVRKAGRYYRPHPEYPTPEAVMRAWQAIRPSSQQATPEICQILAERQKTALAERHKAAS